MSGPGRVVFWGTRGSLPSPGPETARYGGNSSCVELIGREGTRLVLDGGSGIRRLGRALPPDLPRVDILLTHLHLDHIQGLGFFEPLYRPDAEVHIWGPSGTTLDLGARLRRYLSPPLFPVTLRDLPCRLHLHELPQERFAIGEFEVSCDLVCHPGPTLGFRVEGADATVAYLPDHEPILGLHSLATPPRWTSGWAMAEGADLLIHDAQYVVADYEAHEGWGHSTMDHAIEFASLAGARSLALFHHDPAREDWALDHEFRAAVRRGRPSFPVRAAAEGDEIELI